MLFRRGRIWWYEFQFCGRRYRESAKTTNRRLAERAERNRHRQLEESFNGVTLERPQPKLFSVAAEEWLTLKEGTLAPKSYGVEKNSLKHLKPFFSQWLLTDINAAAIARYAGHRRKQSAADKSIKLEIGTLRGILRAAKLWAIVKQDEEILPKLREREDVGRAITNAEEAAILDACRASRSRGLYTAVAIALNTGMREGEIRMLKWEQVDFEERTIRVGKSKTAAGTNRVIPMNDRLTLALRTWGNKFPKRATDHYVFAAEQYGQPGEKKPGTYDVDLTKPIGSWKTAWKTARKTAGVTCRFHDVRHTAVTRLLENGVSFPVVASLLGWSPSTATKMAKRYGHIGNEAHRAAVAALDPRPAAPPSRDATARHTAVNGETGEPLEEKLVG
jgi:integrase